MNESQDVSALMNVDLKDPEAARKYLDAGNKSSTKGDREGAIEAYEAAYAADPDNPEICFRLAYALDLVGEEAEAVHLYEQAVQTRRPALNALMNLAVLYEDGEQYAQAERCVRQVLGTDPNHSRARLYLKDIQASAQMVIVDEDDVGADRQLALLDTPVTDFDLSVRARNALRKMNIRTLADLLRITEAELHGAKNFGEASLEEIKAMLAQRGLRLGQAAEQQQLAAKQAVYDELAATGSDNESLHRSVNELDLSVRARKALALLNINTLGDLCAKTEAELMGVKNFGMTSLTEMKEKLLQLGLNLRRLDE